MNPPKPRAERIYQTTEDELAAVRAGRDKLVEVNRELMEQLQVRWVLRPSTLLAAVSWLSVFALIWLMVLHHVEGGFLTGSSLVFFMLVALVSSAWK